MLFATRLITLLFLAFICLIIVLADSRKTSVFHEWAGAVPHGDKIGHFVLYGLLALGANLSLKGRYVKSPVLQLGSLSVLVFAVIEELTQYFFPSRTLSAWDLLADALGVGVFTVISLFFIKKSL